MAFLTPVLACEDLLRARGRSCIRMCAAKEDKDSTENSGKKRTKRKRVPLSVLWQTAEENPTDGRLWAGIAKRESMVEKKLSALERGLSFDPKNSYLLHMLGMTHLREGQTDTARKTFLQALGVCDSGTKAPFYQALAMLEKNNNKNLELFLKYVKEGLQDNENHGPLYVALASHHVEQGQLQAADDVFTEASLKASNHAPVWRAWAKLKEQQGQLILARAKWEKAISLDAMEPRSWINLAEIVKRLEPLESVIPILKRGLKKNPRSSEILVMLAKVLEEAEDVQSARATLAVSLPEDLMNNNQADPVVLRALAHLEYKAGNVDRAREIYTALAPISVDGAQNVKSTREEQLKALHAWALMEAHEGNEEKCSSLLERASALSPKESSIWRAIAESDARRKQYDGARMAFQQAVNANPEDGRLWVAWGRMEFQLGEFTRAEGFFQKAIEITQTQQLSSLRKAKEIETIRAEALRELASCALQEGNFESCRQCLKQAVQLNPTLLMAWRDLGDIEGKLNGAEAMRYTYKEAIRSAPRAMHAKLFHWLGLEEKRLSNMKAAVDAFEKAIDADETYISTWTSWALLENQQGNVAKACQVFQRAADVASRSNLRVPYLFVSWGRTLSRLGDNAGAVEVFKRGVEKHRGYGFLYQVWGQLEEKQGNYVEARRLYEEGLNVDDKNISLWQSHALLEARRGHFEVARTLFERGLAVDPNNASLLSAYAVAEARQGSGVEKSRVLFKRATKIDPSYSGAWHAWGSVELSKGNIEAAEALYKRASELDPNDPACWHALGMLYRQKRELSHARDHFKRALEADPDHAISYQALALMEYKEGGSGIEKALRILEDAVQLGSMRKCWEIWQSWGVIEYEIGNVTKAFQIMKDAISIMPNSLALLKTYGEMQKHQGHVGQARALFESAVRASPGDAGPTFLVWAKMEEELRNVTKARELYQRAVNADPSLVSGWYLYANLEESVGNTSEADRLKKVANSFESPT